MQLPHQRTKPILVLPAAMLLAASPCFANWPLPPASYAYVETSGCSTSKPSAQSSYQPCIDQMLLLSDAIAKASTQNRKLLVVFGADWCPWCRALDKSLPSADILNHPELSGQIDVIKIATSAIINGQRVKVPGGTAVLDLVLDTSTGDLPAGIPAFALIDPKRPGRAIVRETVSVEDNSSGRDHDRTKVRALLKAMLVALDR